VEKFIKRLPLNSLRVFESAARNQSFALAAEELFITASAVSHQIKTLENYLGLSLFTREKRQISLTPIGENYFTPVRQALNELEVATQRIVDNPETNIVTISVAPNFLLRWLMPRMSRFQAQYPEIELQISASLGLIDFNKNNADMAIYYGNGDWHDIEIHFLRHVYLVPVCSAKLLEGKKPLVQPEDLKQHTLIHVSKRMYEWSEWLDVVNVRNQGFDHGLRLSSGGLATAAAAEGLGIALADSTLSSEEIERGSLVKLFDTPLDTHRAYYLVYQKGKPMNYGMQAFKDWIEYEMENINT
jgi:LysR family glycine cleavage system transcriptional activator